MNNEPYLTSWTVEGGDYSDPEFVEITLSAHCFYPPFATCHLAPEVGLSGDYRLNTDYWRGFD